MQVASNIYTRGAEVLILGCTEIPLVLTGDFLDLETSEEGGVMKLPLIDPMTALARAAIKAINPDRLLPR